MKTGRTITELAQELQRQSEAKADFIAPTNQIIAEAGRQGIALNFADQQMLPVRPTAHGQIASITGVPKRYYDRMLAEDPDLLAMNINAWLGRKDDRRMIRTLDGNVRAMLSDRYARIDNLEIAEAILPVLAEAPEIKIASCEITERRLYIKAVDTRIRGEAKLNDIVEAGVLITNSEIGSGALAITPMIHRLVCLNGMVLNDSKFRRSHVGSRADIGDAAYAMLTDETKQADDKAILLKARDIVKGALDATLFEKNLEKMRAATEGEKMADPQGSIERLSNKMGIQEQERTSILRHLIEGGDLTKWGALNAITRAAQDIDSYDRSTELEQIGGDILNLPASEWRELAEAA